MVRCMFVAFALVLFGSKGASVLASEQLNLFVSENEVLTAPCSIAVSLLTHWPKPGEQPSVQARQLAAYVAGVSDMMSALHSEPVDALTTVKLLQEHCKLDLRDAAQSLSEKLTNVFSEKMFYEGFDQGMQDAKSESTRYDDRPSKW